MAPMAREPVAGWRAQSPSSATFRRVGGARGLGSAAALVAALALAAPASAAEFRVGAARVDITPQPPGPANDPAEFATPNCPPGLDGPRAFAFDEPYRDMPQPPDGATNGRFDYGEPYCDANHNGRYDGIYSSGGVDSLATRMHDKIDARAIAIGDGSKTVVYVSVVAQGLFENYTKLMRDEAISRSTDPNATHVKIDYMVVSANHNESSPDTVGIYGGPATPAGTGGNSGINAYYMDFLQHRVADAAVRAADSSQPATLHALQFRLPPTLRIALSKNFPTTDDLGQPASIDPKVGLLQARGTDGKPIVTVMSLAAHNQEVGHSHTHGSDGQVDISADWPGFFAKRLEEQVGGMAMFLVGDNGSEEDPITVPALPGNDANPYPQAQATGEALADAMAAEAPQAQDLRFGRLDFRQADLTVPLENNAFKAAAAAGLFGDRQTYAGGQQAGRAGPDLRTRVTALKVGPDLQLIDNPAEAFPGLMVGTPFGIEDAPCPSRPNPPVPTWYATAAYRFHVGLADDLIGYISPPWAFTDVAGIYAAPPECQNDPSTDRDSKGHQHKLETEGVGPTAGGIVADSLTGLLKQQGSDPVAVLNRPGRFVYADGTLGRRPEKAVAVWIGDKDATSLSPGKGTIVALPGITGFGPRGVDATGRAMDYDGAEQPGAGDVTTRGMLVYACDGTVARRYYLDLYPALATTRLAAATHGPTEVGCGAGNEGPRSGPVLPAPAAGPGCTDAQAPHARIDRRRTRLSERRVRVRGGASDQGCAGLGAVLVSVAKPRGLRCRFVQANGRLTAPRLCRRPVLLRATGTSAWSLSLRARLPRGRYRVQARAVDLRGNMETPGRVDVVRVRVR
jgi:hypothetical protein